MDTKPQPTGRRQHIVPQQMIRRFAGLDHKLFGMKKSDLQIEKRKHGPKGILVEDDFYKDTVSDFDAGLLWQIEQKFAHIYSKIVNNEPIDGHGGAALIDWIASMLVRTRLVNILIGTVPNGLPKSIEEPLRNAVKLFVNVERAELFKLYQDLMTRVGWSWKKRRFPDQCLILTDHPVCITSIDAQGVTFPPKPDPP
jgi:hypothetical protein